MRPGRTASIVALALCLTSLAAAQAPVNLTTWSAESYPAVNGFGAGQWNVTPGGQTVVQSVNGQPTLFYSDFSAFNTQVTGQITVTGSDDDYIGFVFGYQPGDVTNPNADYLLLDWKRNTQGWNFSTPSCTTSTTAARGLAVSRVTGIPTADEFWGHVDFDNASCSPLGHGLTELARGATLDDTGWQPGVTYAFDFVFNATTFQVSVDGNLEISISGNFANGRLGFYNFSQADVIYNAFTVSVVCPNAPVRQNYGTGTPGTTGVPGLILDADPVVGTSFNLVAANSSGQLTTGALIAGIAPASISVPPLGGTLLVDPLAPSSLLLTVQVPSPALVMPVSLPSHQALCGLAAWLQLVQFDTGASGGYSLTPGLEVVIGD